ncbi:hypothetical protein HP436_00265 [Pseudomonas sp. CrR14]|nr:hypothetical protein [Pseudomonas sp. CrR14]
MADRLRVRIDPNNSDVCRTADGYTLFACTRRFFRVAVIRPRGCVPIAYFQGVDEAAAFVRANRSALVQI